MRDGACPEHNGVFLSFNFELYADVSNRVMRTIQGMVPDVEAYSIDKCWADLIGMLGVLGAGPLEPDASAYAHRRRDIQHRNACAGERADRPARTRGAPLLPQPVYPARAPDR
ncbi:hypothetical protein [Pseudomonas oryzihabitans]|uniref:Y-family DNA polymerase n=1 Tax=Pseudomonas oryzihabitans TaxID=47885 RepID=UPI003965D38A